MTARGESRVVPPPAVPSPNICVEATGSRSWCGDSGPATRAKLAAPSDVAIADDGSVLVADTINNVVRRIRTDGTIVSIAGTGEQGPADQRRAATATGFDGPRGVAATANGGVLVADTGNDAIRLVSANGTVKTLASRSGPAVVGLNEPTDVTPVADGAYVVSDTGNNRVLLVSPDGAVRVVAGSRRPGYSGDGGPGPAARLTRPTQVFAAPDGSLLIADTGNDAVRRVSPSGVIDTVATGIAATGVAGLPDGAIIVGGGGTLQRIDADGTRSTLAGGAEPGFNGDDAPAQDVRLDTVMQVAVTPDGRVFLAERGSDRVRVLDSDGMLETLAGSGTPIPAPKLDVAAGAFPPELGGPADRGTAGHGPVAQAAASSSACENYNPRFATFTLIPMSRQTLRATRRRAAHGRRVIALRFASSRRAAVVIEITRDRKPGGRAFRRRVGGGHRGNRIRISGRFRRGTYIARLYGSSVSDDVKRCDVKRVHVR